MQKAPHHRQRRPRPLICDDDLVWALDNGYIRGAALDMVESEDPDLSTCPLVGRDDVLLTPHSGYYSDTSNYLVAKLSMDNACTTSPASTTRSSPSATASTPEPFSRQFPLGCQFLFFHPSFCSVLRFYRTNLLSYQPSSGFPIFPCSRPVSGAGTGLKTGTRRAPCQVSGAFLRLTVPRKHSKIKKAGGGPPEKENVF